MQVLAEAASREAELQPRPNKHQQLTKRLTTPMPRIHTMNKTQIAGVKQLTTGKTFTGQKVISQQAKLNNKIQQTPSAIVPGQLQQTFKQIQTKLSKQTKQTITNTNVLKSSSLPNIPSMSKFSGNSNLILAAKQQQVNVPNIQQQVQRTQNPGTRTHQQHMLLKVGPPNKSQTQNLQTGNIKSNTSKMIKSTNQQQAVIQQPVQRGHQNVQGMMMIQHNIVGPQNTQKQPGCIKTLTPQKPAQRNHMQKNLGIKTSLNTNMNSMKAAAGAQVMTLNMPLNNTVQQKSNVRTLLPQQSSGIATTGVSGTHSAGIVHKISSQSSKFQQQVLQHKQIVMTTSTPAHYTQTVKSQSGQIKTLLPIGLTESRRETEIKVENTSELKQGEDGITAVLIPSQFPQSPQRRMPLPYECLQFVLQDHNYGAPPPRTPPPQSPPPHSKQQPVNGAGNSCITTQHSYIFNQVVSNTTADDDAASAISSEVGREVEPEGEETETAPEGEGDDEDSITRCICDFEHDDGYMICCDRCLVWQHVDCMGIDRANIPDEYLCEICRPRRVDRARARALQMRKREELLNSDTSSDSSSTSSADTDVGQNTTTKNRKGSAQQQSIPRRKSDPPPQVRRLNNNNNNNNNNIAKRQRRDMHPRQTNTVRNKKELNVTASTATTQVAKQQRGPPKRKAKRRTSLDDKEEETQDAWGSNMAPLRQWIERYEEAVTNHYSPELRARISSIKVNGTHNDLRQNNIGAAAIGKCRLNIQSNNLRFLVATMYLPPNTPIVELRGKYMLSTQHRPSHLQGRQHIQRPGPFVFFYRLPRDGTEVCVDTRTYGNDARFVRRSCKPNAEVKHCIEKGTLHLYIVTSLAIEKNAEITIRHDQHDIMLSPNSNSSMIPIMCACNSLKDCQIVSLTATPMNKKGNNGPLAENADGRERRRRGRRNTISEDINETSISTTSIVVTTNSATSPVVTAPIVVQSSPKKTVTINTNTNVSLKDTLSTSSISNVNSANSNVSSTPATVRQIVKEEQLAPLQHTQSIPVNSQSISKVVAASSTILSTLPTQTSPEPKKDKKKMTREERKMEAIMKAFERLEKAEQRKQEVQARNAQRKESGGLHSDNEDSSGHASTKKQSNTDKTARRKRRKGRTRSNSTSQSQGTRRTRLNSAESDLTSGDESNSMQSPPLSNQNCSYSLRLQTAKELSTSNNDSGSITQTDTQRAIPTAAGLLLALANSNVPGSNSPPQQQPTPLKSPTCDSGASSSSQSSTPSTPLSSACLLVAAAVGPLAPGFKFPKTKKLLMNEWLKESPEPHSQSVEMRASEFACSSEQPSEFLSQNYAAKSLATLVQAAHSVSGVCESTRQCDKQPSTPSASRGSAKKRWLRQAISEECDSPNSSRPESPPSEMVAPPKKRRIARESLSSDNYTPPNTPTMLQQDHMPMHLRSINEDDFVEQLHSPNNEDLGSQTEYDSDQVKDEIKPKFSITAEMDRKCKINSPVALTAAFLNDEKGSILPMKIKEESKSDDEEVSLDTIKNSIKLEKKDIKTEYKSEIKSSIKIKTEPHAVISETPKVAKKSVKIEEIIQRGTVEIIDQNEEDLETDDLSSPIAVMESDAELKQRVAELRLEFGGNIAELSIVNNDSEKSFHNQTDLIHIKCENRFDDTTSIDEFDVEAQMKKITGDDGDDYKEKVEINSERDKSMDGIEGLMESSKEDSESDSEERDIDHFKDSNETYKKSCEKMEVITNVEKRVFKEFECKNNLLSIEEEFEAIKQQKLMGEKTKIIIEQTNLADKESLDSIERELECSENIAKEIDRYRDDDELTKQSYKSFSIITPEESMMELDSMELPSEEISEEPAKFFPSIPPLSERIRKKVDSNSTSKSSLKIEASIIESSLDLEKEDAQNGEEKKMLSTALRELLEAKIESENESIVETSNTNEIENRIPIKSEIYLLEETLNEKTPEICIVPPPVGNQQVHKEATSIIKKEESLPFEHKRLKDPRTVVPNKMPNPSPSKTDGPPPVKRKLSISEYRKRKQQSTGTPPEPENSDMSIEGKGVGRRRSDSASSSTSSLSSDDEGISKPILDIPSLGTLPMFANADSDEKKGGDEGIIGWSAAPTLVERQRENLTERLKREFGLFLNDDDEERARKQGLSSIESLLKSTSTVTGPAVATTAAGNVGIVGYPVAQLPPQPYIPPPGSASIHYSQYPQVKTTGSSQIIQYPGYPLQVPSAPGYTTNTKPSTSTSPQQFAAVTQAPPGANPYPPGPVPLLVATPPLPPPPPPVPPPTTSNVSAARFSPATSQTAVSAVIVYPLPPPQSHKNFYNHPAPRS